MNDSDAEGIALEKTVRGTLVRVQCGQGESLTDCLARLTASCDLVDRVEAARERSAWLDEVRPEVEEATSELRTSLKLDSRSFADTGITSDYHMVMLSLLFRFDECIGATEVSRDWNGINTGRVSRVFRASRSGLEKYRGHFEQCENRRYRFSREGLEYAIKTGVSELIDQPKKT